MKHTFKTLFATSLLALCATVPNRAQTSYSIAGRLDAPEMEGRKVYLQMLDSRKVIDSATVANGTFSMAGTAKSPLMARIDAEETKYFAAFVLEDSVTVDLGTRKTSGGGPLNLALNEYHAKYEAIFEETMEENKRLKEQYPDEDAYEAANKKKITEWMARFQALYKDVISAHPNDGVGEKAWNDGRYDAVSGCNPGNLRELYACLGPGLLTLKSAERGKTEMESLEKTAVGQPFTDVEGTSATDKPVRLSDYAGKGKLVVVDFWASWCGPCRMEGKETLKPLWEKYKNGDDVTIVSVAVRDRKEKTLKAIKDDGFDWPQIIDTKDEVLSEYGLMAIPHIILLDRNGIILARSLRGGAIEREIQKHLND